MKITRIQLERYKKFPEKALDFTDDDIPLNLVLLLGENGSGKSSVLQAIAATIGCATGQIDEPLSLQYPGFSYKGISENYRGYAKISIDIEFTQSEVTATRAFFHESDLSTDASAIEPSEDLKTNLTLINQPGHDRPMAASRRQYFQFRGRQYAYSLLNTPRQQPDMFKKIGSIYWYHEQRNSYSLMPEAEGKYFDEEKVRRLITYWFTNEAGRKKLETFNKVYGRLFHRHIARIGESVTGEDAPILLKDDSGREYELNELSGGEKALFPILLDFTQWDIHNSIILIDEIELHLHPPLQQSFLSLLPELGHDNQFIITTHSDWIASLIPDSKVRRLDE